jgi:hypothetical protein
MAGRFAHPVRRRPRPAAREALHVAGGEVRARPRERPREPLEGIERQPVVAVHEREELAAGRLHARVARVPEAAVGLPHEPQARVALGMALGDRRAAVGRPVVDDDDLEVAERLPRQRPQAVVEIGLDVVDRHDDADERHPRLIVRAKSPRDVRVFVYGERRYSGVV